MPRSQNVARPGTCSTRTASYTMPSAATVQPALAIATGQNHTSGTRASANHSAAPTSTGGSSRTASTAARLSSAFEPTATESRETLDEAAEIFRKLYELGHKDPEYMHAAPHHAQIGRPDEVQAARNPILRWTRA